MKKRMTKVLALLLSLLMLAGLVSCGSGGEKPAEEKTETADTEPAEDTPAEETPVEEQPAEGAADEQLAAEQVFNYYTASEPSTLDPWMNGSGSASILISALHEPMLRYAENEQGWEPALMTDYQANEDNTVHTMTLRDGAKWADGTPITMDDILYSFYRVLDPALGSPVAYRYYPIVNAEKLYNGECSQEELGIKALDEHTLEITTAEPCDYFVDMLTSDMFAPVQKAAAEKDGELYGTDVDKIVSSGPFVLTEWVHKNSMVLTKNEEYWDAENVKLQTLNVTITTDNNTILGMYQNGDLSLFKVPNDMFPQYAEDPTLITDARLQVTFIEFNPSNEFLANKNIREAFSIAFNRQVFAQQVMNNIDLAAYGLVPRGVVGMEGGDFREQAGAVVSDAADEASITRAKELLDTGLKELNKTVEDLQSGFSIQCLESGKVQAQAIQNMWKTNLGVEMPVSVMDINVLLPMLMEGTFDCVIGGGQDSNYRDPQGFMQFIYDEGKWDNEEFRALVEKAHSQTGDERIKTWMEVEKMVLDNFIYVPQCYAENHWVLQPNVRGLLIKTFGYEIDFKHVYLVEQ